MRIRTLLALSLLLSALPLHAETWNQGFASITAPNALVFRCVIPDHNGGKWGCGPSGVLIFSHTTDRATEFKITNLSVLPQESVTFTNIDYRQKVELPVRFEGDRSRNSFRLRAGPNLLRVEIIEEGVLVSQEEFELAATLKKIY